MYYPKLNVVFPHIPKTGGSTLEYHLGQIEHPEIYKDYIKVKRKMSFLNVLYKKYSFEGPDRRWSIHRFAKMYLQNLGEDYYNYYSFCLLRNPFSQIRSMYSMNLEDMKRRKREYPTWEEYIFNNSGTCIKNHWMFIDQVKYVCHGDHAIVNELFPFEYYEDVMNRLGKKFGFKTNFDVKLWATKPTQHFTADMVERVMDMYADSYYLWKKVKKHWERRKTPYVTRKKGSIIGTSKDELTKST